MTDSNFDLRAYNILPLDIPLQISTREEEFFKIVTKIEDWEELKAHITKVQVEAYESIYSYPCIRSFNFCRFKVSFLSLVFIYVILVLIGLFSQKGSFSFRLSSSSITWSRERRFKYFR